MQDKPTLGIHLKKLLGLLVGSLMAGALFWWAYQQVNPSSWQSMWRSVPPWGWLAAGLMWAGSLTLRAVRLQREWQWKLHAPLYEVTRIVLFHNAAVLLLPLRAGELGYPYLVRKTYGCNWREALQSLMWLRLQDAMVLASLAVLLWPGLPLAWRILATPGLALFLMPKSFWRRILKSRHPIARLMTPWMHRRGTGSGWWLSLGNWLLKITAVAGLLHTTTASTAGLGVLQSFSAALGGELAALIPVQGPAALGTYEAGVWFFSGAPLSTAPLVGLAALQVHAFCLAVSLGLAGVWGLLDALVARPNLRAKNQ